MSCNVTDFRAELDYAVNIGKCLAMQLVEIHSNKFEIFNSFQNSTFQVQRSNG